MKKYEDFAKESQQGYLDSLALVTKEVENAVKENRLSVDKIVSAAVGSIAGHTNRMLSMYHAWLSEQIDK